jgi:hypothetical protein
MNSTPAAISREALRGELAGLKNDWVAVDPKRKVVATDSMSRIDVKRSVPISAGCRCAERFAHQARQRRHMADRGSSSPMDSALAMKAFFANWAGFDTESRKPAT